MNMIPDAVRIRLFVDDYDRAIDFYVNQLGLFAIESDRGAGSDRTVSLHLNSKCPNFVLDLSDVSAEPAYSPLIGNQSGNAILMTIPIDDVEAMETTIRSSNIEIDGRNELPYAEWLFLKDPFGNRIALCEEFR